MRTKTLLLTAIATGVAASAMAADPVYSQNVVGFVNTSLKTGYNLICPPLAATNNTIAAIFPTVPDGSTLTRWDPSTQSFGSPASFDSGLGGWDIPDMTLTAGEAVFLNVGSDATITFVGEVRQGNLSTPVSANYSMIGSQVPQQGGITSVLGWTTVADGTTVATFDPQTGYSSPASYDSGLGGWDAEPVINIAQGVVISSPVSGSWARTFSVQ